MADATNRTRRGAPTALAGDMALTPYREIQGQAVDVLIDGNCKSVRWTAGSRLGWTDHDTAFLIGRGYSATLDRWRQAVDADVPTMAVNDCPHPEVRPRMWCTGDPPAYFKRSLWLDPQVCKYCPIEYADMFIPRDSAYGPENQHTPATCPNVHFFHKNVNSDPREFLDTPWVNWGSLSLGKGTPFCDTAHGVRSSMLVGLRLMYHLGFKTVVLLGADFTPHTHPDPEYYAGLSRQLAALRPVFEQHGYTVLNANPDSHLRVFDFVDFDEVLSHLIPGTAAA